MTLRSLLVLLDGDDARTAVRSTLAARLAAAHRSQLIGIAPTGSIELTSGISAAAHYSAEAATLGADSTRQAFARADRFRALCQAAGLDSAEAAVIEGDRAQVVLHHAHSADLSLIGRADPSQRDDQRFVEQVLMNNPRPTLVVPPAVPAGSFADKVLLTWDGSRGCARAAADALPLLRIARQVRLRMWRRDGDPNEAALRPRLDNVDRWLRWHGVVADIGVETAGAPIGDAILDEAAAFGAGLIVMGTYGHARWAERILGGATRTALARAPIPLLMSH